MPRRLTGAEEAELVKTARQLEQLERDRCAEREKLDRLIFDIWRAGARATDIADVLDIPRSAVYAARDRAEAAKSSRG